MDMGKQTSRSLFHGLDHNTKFGCHRGVRKLERVEVQDDIQDFICDDGARTDENGKRV